MAKSTTWWCIGEDIESTQELAGHPDDNGIDPAGCEQAKTAEEAYRKRRPLPQRRQYRHGVRDRMTGEIIYTTRAGSYEETHRRAERRARGDRYEVVEIN